MIRDDLFPEIASRRNGFLEVGDGHAIYWEESGARDGIPVVFLHGGPGSGTSPTQRRFFDSRAYRIILFDQRGAGRSKPRAGLEGNTTPNLIADMERLRRHLDIGSWLVFGGSWGATLALAYGQAHPERCLGFVLRGVFLGRNSEIQWFMSGIRGFFPEVWRAFAEFIPMEEREDLLGAYYRRLIDPDPEQHLSAARHWARYEASCSALLPEPGQLWPVEDPGYALGLARLEAHYFVNGMFLASGGLLAGMGRIRHLPATIVQGRYDMICPPASADALARVWPGAELIYVPDAGHAAMEPGIRRALVRATERFKTELVQPAAVE
ncbi:MAG: prolyl aminopeptidase [Thalassobaculaceae bacterium]|nr:prolyl aminopeptidase [Thalassobaculaceae bacterium]